MLYSKKLRRMAARCRTDAVLVESDGPVSFGALEGAMGPGMIPSVALKLAELWGEGFEAAVEQLSLNAKAFLGQQG